MNGYVSSCDECGWTSKTCRSEKQATYALARHSCDKQRERAARAARRIAREAAVDKTPKPCHHKQAQHIHGTHACYVLDSCRCPDCTTANTTYERQRIRQHAYGRWNGYVPADAAREHVERLQAAGMGWKRIAHAANVPTGTMWKLLYGVPSTNRPPSQRIRPATEAAILAVRLDLAPGAVVPSVGTARRLQALVAIGWSMSKLANRIGILPSNFGPLIHGTRGTTVETDRTVRDLYDQLWNEPPPATGHRDKIARSRALSYAAEHQWAPPMAWDEDEIDNPDAAPHTEQEGKPGGKRIHVEDVEFLLAHEPLATAQQLADRLHVTRDAVQQTCRRDDRQDLLDQLARNADLAKPGRVARRRPAA